ncbi:MAG: GNAT family N-acetyltransferase [Verrucomicrobiales bacterium]
MKNPDPRTTPNNTNKVCGPIGKSHETAQFDCGVPALNDYLRRFALQNHANCSAKTFVALRGSKVIGYYSLAATSAECEEPPARVTKGLARHPVPLILVARLAVDLSERGKGLGRALMRDALLRIDKVAEDFGCRAVVVHAKDEEAKAFYEKCGFEPSPVAPNHLYLLLKDIRAAIHPSDQ